MPSSLFSRTIEFVGMMICAKVGKPRRAGTDNGTWGESWKKVREEAALKVFPSYSDGASSISITRRVALHAPRIALTSFFLHRARYLRDSCLALPTLSISARPLSALVLPR